MIQRKEPSTHAKQEAAGGQGEACVMCQNKRQNWKCNTLLREEGGCYGWGQGGMSLQSLCWMPGVWSKVRITKVPDFSGSWLHLFLEDEAK